MDMSVQTYTWPIYLVGNSQRCLRICGWWLQSRTGRCGEEKKSLPVVLPIA